MGALWFTRGACYYKNLHPLKFSQLIPRFYQGVFLANPLTIFQGIDLIFHKLNLILLDMGAGGRGGVLLDMYSYPRKSQVSLLTIYWAISWGYYSEYLPTIFPRGQLYFSLYIRYKTPRIPIGILYTSFPILSSPLLRQIVAPTDIA